MNKQTLNISYPILPPLNLLEKHKSGDENIQLKLLTFSRPLGHFLHFLKCSSYNFIQRARTSDKAQSLNQGLRKIHADCRSVVAKEENVNNPNWNANCYTICK